jgi:hypothetical protein
VSQTSPADSHLEAAVTMLTSSRESHRLTAAWANDPVLAVWTPAQVAAALEHHHDSRPQLFAALVRRGQAGDQDASLLALAALRKGLWALVHLFHRHDPDAFDEALGHAVVVLAAVDPDLDDIHRTVLGRVRCRLARERRWRDLPVPNPAELPARACDESIFDQVQARLTLRRLADLAARGQVPEPEWSVLVALRIEERTSSQIAASLTDGRTAHQVRSDTSRFARHLRTLVA